MKIAPPQPLTAFGLALLLSWTASAQPIPRRGPVEPPRVDPPVAPVAVSVDPAELARERAFVETLTAAGEAGRRDSRIQLLRRLAPLDLDWGLRTGDP